MSASHMFKQGVRYQGGDGKSIRIWESTWLLDFPNFRPATRQPTECNNLTQVHQIVSEESKERSAHLLQQLFSPQEVEIIGKIQSVKLE